jgi:hypothetical protein
VPVAQHIPVRPVGLTGRGGHGLVSSDVRSALVDDLAVDDRGVLGERHRRADLGHRTRGREGGCYLGARHELGPQLTAFFTSAAILASSAAVSSVSAKAVGHMAPSSRFAASLKPNVAYLVLNFCALWKKQTTLPSLA